MMKVVSLNSRGLGHPSKTKALRDLINQEKPEIILLQETKQGETNTRKIISKEKQYDGTLSKSRGASGGLATLWSTNTWQPKGTTVNQNWLKIVLENNGNQ